MTKQEAITARENLVTDAPVGVNYRIYREPFPDWWDVEQCREHYETEGWHVAPYDLGSMLRRARREAEL